MAQESEIRKILRIEGIETVKQLREYVKSLQDALVKADVGTEEYTKTTHNLILAQEKLGEVTKKNKQEQEAAKDSIIGMQREYKELYNTYVLLSKEERESEFGKETAKRLAELSETLNTTKKEVGNFKDNIGHYSTAFDDFDKIIGGLKQSSGDMVQGFTAMGTSLGLTVSGADGLGDSLEKVKAIILVLNGTKGAKAFIKGLKEMSVMSKASAAGAAADAAAKTGEAAATGAATVAQEGLNTAMKLNPIGLLLAGLSALIVYFKDIVAWVQKIFGLNTEEKIKSITNANEDLTKSFDDQNKKAELNTRIMEAQGKSAKEVIQAKKDLVDTQIKETKATIDNMNARLAQLKADSAWTRFWKGENKQIKAMEEELKKLTETYNNLKEASDAFADDITVENTKEQKKSADQAKAIADEKNKTYQAAIQKSKEYVKQLKEEKYNEQQKIYNAYYEGRDYLDTLKEEYKQKGKNIKQDKEWKELQEANVLLNEKLNRELKTAAIKDFADATSAITSENENLSETIKQWSKLDAIIGPLTGKNLKQFNDDVLKAQKDNIQEEINALLDSLQKTYPQFMGDTFEDIMNTEGNDAYVQAYIDKYKELVAASQDIDKEMLVNLADFAKYAMGSDDPDDRWWAIRRFIGLGEQEGLSPEMLDKVKEYIQPIYESIYDMLRDPNFIGRTGNIFDILFSVGSANETVKKFDAVMSHMSAVLGSYGSATSSILDSVASAWENSLNAQKNSDSYNEESAKKQFKAIKALQYASTWINTLAGMSQALSDPDTPSYWLRAANAAAVLATGIANTIAISNTQFDGETAGGINSSAAIVQPQIVEQAPMYVANTNTGEYIDALNDQKVYILDSEIAAAGRKVERRESETTF